MSPNPMNLKGFGAMDVTKPCGFIGFGAMEDTKPYEFIAFGAMEVTKPYEFIGFGAMDVTKPYECFFVFCFLFWKAVRCGTTSAAAPGSRLLYKRLVPGRAHVSARSRCGDQ